MDLDLSDDQVALRDGIASLLDGALRPTDRVRAGFDRAMFDELAEAGRVLARVPTGSRGPTASWCSSSSARACVPGPLVAGRCSSAAAGIAGGRPPRRRRPACGRAPRRARRAARARRRRRRAVVDAGASARRRRRRGRSTRCTPVARIGAVPAGERDRRPDARRRARSAGRGAHRGVRARPRRPAAPSSRSATRRTREQFDRPIGSFQAIKHLLADMLVRTEVARASVYTRRRACSTTRRSSRGPSALVAAPRSLAGEAAIVNGKSATQVFGGMGFTWEVDVHLYLKRAWVLDTHFESADRNARSVSRGGRGSGPPGQFLTLLSAA